MYFIKKRPNCFDIPTNSYSREGNFVGRISSIGLLLSSSRILWYDFLIWILSLLFSFKLREELRRGLVDASLKLCQNQPSGTKNKKICDSHPIKVFQILWLYKRRLDKACDNPFLVCTITFLIWFELYILRHIFITYLYCFLMHKGTQKLKVVLPPSVILSISALLMPFFVSCERAIIGQAISRE